RDRLQGHIYALLAAAELDARGALRVAENLPEARFATPGSGLYARVLDPRGEAVWRSPSLLGARLAFTAGNAAPGEAVFRRVHTSPPEYFLLDFGVAWERGDHGRSRYTFQVAETLERFTAQVGGFRRNLWSWLAGLALVLLAVQGSILRWGLAPLHKVAGDLARIKSGSAGRLDGRYPRELAGLTDSINSFIASERAQRDRYRDTLGDLAHSLKTPLAVIRGALDGPEMSEGRRRTLEEQVDRLGQIVDYQLQRAATSGSPVLGAPLAVAPVLGRVVRSLDTVYAERGLERREHIDERSLFRGDQGDLMELLGNLLENAYKWARAAVAVSVRPTGPRLGAVEIRVEDDGPGIPAAQRAAVLDRGVRADGQVQGHGIGLAVVRDIVDTYGGTMELGESEELGGARVTICLPNG
ncbi:MAG: histidine kinase, partial [Gammaproteobacteria bacterium]|nr:histidine kinase [Gammaproteobacteria bacterium]NIR28561.1 histidine kinase [Gammaproteobacteria bacterium]NIR97031.1 histidine kinase [Gammaproteobacteria bacterium]NIT62729.1 histidine kinase [Gammaproteobacteria bacterium]NIV19687.1 histidine kinase [Gammaproteobacteria bacterium]